MKRLLEILRDKSGRQDEVLILLAIIGIILAIALPQIIRFWGEWSSLVKSIVTVAVFLTIIISVPLLIGYGFLALRRRRRVAIRLWDLTAYKQLGKIRTAERYVSSVAFSPDAELLASSGSNGVRLWEVATGEELKPVGEEASPIAFSPDGQLLAGATFPMTFPMICLWEVATGKELHKLEGHERLIRSIAFSPNGELLASGSDDKTIRLWEVATGKELHKLEKHEDLVRSVAFSHNGKLLASGSDDQTICMWDMAAGKPLPFRKLGGNESVALVAFSPDGKILASVELSYWSRSYWIRLWEVATGKELHNLEKHEAFVSSVAFSPNGKILASGSKKVRLWEVTTGKEIKRLKGNLGEIRSIAFSLDGGIMATGANVTK